MLFPRWPIAGCVSETSTSSLPQPSIPEGHIWTENLYIKVNSNSNSGTCWCHRWKLFMHEHNPSSDTATAFNIPVLHRFPLPELRYMCWIFHVLLLLPPVQTNQPERMNTPVSRSASRHPWLELPNAVSTMANLCVYCQSGSNDYLWKAQRGECTDVPCMCPVLVPCMCPKQDTCMGPELEELEELVSWKAVSDQSYLFGMREQNTEGSGLK